MTLTEKQLQEIKQIELDLLKSFISVCEKLNLKYYVIGGTLLGAVRHKGFIPWDDDIDIGMPRKDYEVFLKRGQALLPEDFFLQCLDSDPDIPFNFAKIRNSNTTFQETSVRKIKINHGVYIDIFPLDFYPTSKNAIWRLKIKKFIFKVRIATVLHIDSLKGKLAKIAGAILALRYPKYQSAIRKREELYKATSKGGLYANHSGAWGDKEIMPCEWYGDGVCLEFEGLTVCAPKEYDKWLTQVYGDYMQLPPPEKRQPHHYVDIFDLNKSYKEYSNKGVNK